MAKTPARSVIKHFLTRGHVIAMDGKKMRRSHDLGCDQKALSLVSPSRSVVLLLAVSVKIFTHPISCRASFCRSRVWSCVETRA